MRQIDLAVPKAAIKAIIRECEECQSIDLLPVNWPKGTLNVDEIWY